MNEPPIGGKDPEPEAQNRTVVGTLRDMALERYPEAKPAIQLIKQEAKEVRKGWKFFIPAAFILIGASACATWYIESKRHATILASTNSFFASSNSFLLGKLGEKDEDAKQKSKELDGARANAKDESLRLTLQLNETKREKDAEIARLTAEKNSALQRVAELEALPSTAATMYSGATNLFSIIEDTAPRFELRLNRDVVTNNATFSLKSSRRINLSVLNLSAVTADNVVIAFSAPLGLGTTNVSGEGWIPKPPITRRDGRVETPIANRWEWRADHPVGPTVDWSANFFEISTNFAFPVIAVTLDVYGSKSKLQRHNVTLVFE